MYKVENEKKTKTQKRKLFYLKVCGLKKFDGLLQDEGHGYICRYDSSNIISSLS